MKNLFPNSFRQSHSSLLKPGSYLVELASIRPAPARDFGDGNPPRNRITFCFKTKTGEPVNRTLTASTDPRSRLVEFVRQMAGHNIPTEDHLRDGEKLTAYLKSLVGKKFTASIVPSRNGRFNDIVSISSSKQLGEAA
ncbi:MAG: hypothetical protein EBS93_08405 [Chitinophagia bacterium]|nr:hypothetical protein [Chitinophagia bacterium]NCA30722.1 hypothetical protein [Chitinophagia bacterium]